MFWGQEQVCSTRGFESNFTQTFPKLQKRTKCLAKCAVSLSLTAKHNFAWAWIQYPKSVIYLDLDLLERALSPIPSLVLSPHALERHHSHSCTRLTPAQSELLHPASYSWNKSWVQLSNKLAEHMNTNRSCSSYDTAKSPPLSRQALFPPKSSPPIQPPNFAHMTFKSKHAFANLS